MKGIQKLFIAAGLVAVVFAFNSCKSTSKGYQSSPVISRDVDLDPIKADIQVDETKKLKGNSEALYLFGFRVKGDKEFADGIKYSTYASGNFSLAGLREGKIKAAAAYKALNDTDWDFMIHPTYMVKRKFFLIGTRYEVEVTGYGAKYHNFRTEPDTLRCCPEDGFNRLFGR